MADLREHETQPRISERFLADLKRVHEMEFGLPSTFLAELNMVYATDNWVPAEKEDQKELSLEQMQALGETLGKWREDCRRLVHKELSRLSEDHPIKCPVSLYGAPSR